MKTNWGTGTDMTRCAPGITLAVMLLLAVPALGQQYYLYSPVPLDREEKVQRQDGILVREVPVQKGDTLFGLSRKFSGHGIYFSQILLFNNINDPDLIYAGDTLKVPVTRKESAGVVKRSLVAKPPSRDSRTKARPQAILPRAGSALRSVAPQAELSIDDLKQTEDAKMPARQERAKKSIPSDAVGTVTTQPATPLIVPQEQKTADSGSTAAGQKFYERAMKAYRQDDCRTALELFDRFLVADPSSPLAADASLYKAECYLKQSNQ